MKARKRFLLRDQHQNKVATVITFFDTVMGREIGFITTFDYNNHVSDTFIKTPDVDIIADLASRLGVTYHDYIEVPVSK